MPDYPFNLSGPHSPEETRRVADLLAECVRYLNYCSRPGEGGLEYPADVHDLVGNLKTLTERLPQLLNQCAGFLRTRAASGRLADTRHDEAALWARVCANDLGALASHLGDVAANLGRRQSDLSSLYVKGDDDAVPE